MDNENEFIDPQENEAEKKEDGISSDLIRGHINTIILRTLATGDKYGYEIIDEIETKSHGLYSIKQPTLYSALKRLESQGYVTSYWGGSSGGGRRRYFSITEEGNAFYTKNQEEWLYSRSIIDSLIANQPAPVAEEAPVEEVEEIPTETEAAVEAEAPVEEVAEETPVETVPDQVEEVEPVEETTEPEIEEVEETEETDEEEELPTQNPLSTLRSEEGDLPEDEPYEEEEEESPAPAPSGAYKDVLDQLYNNAIDSVETKSDRKITKAEPQQITGNIEFFNILEQAEYDGIRVKTSGVYKPKEAIVEEPENPTAFFNCGKALFFSSLATFAFLAVEFIIMLATSGATDMGLGYPFTVLALSVVMVAICTTLFLMGFGKNSILKKNSSLPVIAIIAFAVIVLLITAFAISSQANLSDAKELMKSIVFPSIVASNVVVFVFFYRFFKKRT